MDENAKCIQLDDQCTTKYENLNYRTKFSSITISQKNSSAQLQKHIQKLQTLLKELNLVFKRDFAHVQ
jgi:hypothetical protein